MSSFAPQELLSELERLGFIRTNGHFMQSDERHHMSTFIATRFMMTCPSLIHALCEKMAHEIAGDTRFVASSPGSSFGLMLAFVLTKKLGHDVHSVFIDNYANNGHYTPDPAHQRLVSGLTGVLFDPTINNHRVSRRNVEAAERLGGRISATVSFCNHGGYTPETLWVDRIHALISQADMVQRYGDGVTPYMERECPMCDEGMPLNLEFGYALRNQRRKERFAAQQALAQQHSQAA